MNWVHFLTSILLSISSSSRLVKASDNGLAITPQMGWNTWSAFGCGVSADLLINSGQQLVRLGLKDVGYTYVLQDDCWSAGRNSTGHLQADPSKFPNGIPPVADQLHDMGLGLGIYSDAGALTCARFEGSLGHEEIDAQTWASWGIDYLKYDNCFNEGQTGTPIVTYKRYAKMASALNATGRPILYSMCNWGEDGPWNWAQTIANSWRITGDVYDTFDKYDDACPCEEEQGIDCKLPGFRCSVMNVVNKVAKFVDKPIVGAWNDMDLLQIGNGGMTDDEYITHFSLWAVIKSPLIMANDLSNLNPQAYSILSNPAILAISQDPGSRPAVRRWRYFVKETDSFGKGEIQMWAGSQSNGDEVVLLVNAGNSDREMNATLSDIFWDSGPIGNGPQVNEAWDVYDLWANRMDNETAAQIIAAANGESSTDPNSIGTEFRYNATANGGYASGLSQGLPVLFGKKIGTVEPHGSFSAKIARHGTGVFRLRRSSSLSVNAQKDEL